MMVLALSAPGSRIDLSIEGMHSQRFGVGVFFLLMLGIVLGGERVTRTGEKWMFGAIIFGVVAAVVFASLQMLSGVLF